MDLNFGGVNELTPAQIPLPLACNYFTDQATPAGCVGAGSGTTQQELFLDHQLLHHIHPHPPHLPYAHDMHLAVQIEIEKEWVRGEIIMSEIARMFDLMMGSDLALKMCSGGYPFGSSSQKEFYSPLGLSLSGTTVEDRSLKEMTQTINGTCERGEINKLPLQRVVAEPEVSEAKPDEWNCALCHVVTPNERSLNQHLRGKKHKLKEASLRVEGAGNNYSTEPPVMATMFAEGAIKPSVEEVKCTDQSLLARESEETSLKELNPPPLQEILNVDDLKKNQGTVTQEVEWTCTLCEVVASNEQALNEHMKEKKLKLKEAGAEISPMTTSQSVQVGGTPKSCMEEGRSFTSDSLLLEKTGKRSSNEQGVVSLQENHNLGDFNKIQSAVARNVEWSCALCQIIAPNARALNEHLLGKKHKKKHKLNKATLRDEVAGKDHCSGPSSMEVSKSVQGAVTIDPAIRDGVKFSDESLLDASSQKQDLPSLPESLGSDYFLRECQVITPKERALNEHLRGMKHKLKEVALRAEGAEKSCNIGLPLTATNSVQVEESIDQSMEERVKFTPESLPLKKSGEASLLEYILPPLPVNLNFDNLKKNQCAVAQKTEWNCALCQVVVPNEQSLNEHLQGKKHKLEEAGSDSPLVMASKSVQVDGTTYSSMEGMKFGTEPLPNGETGEKSSKKQGLPSLLENMNLSDLKKNQSELAKNVKSSCDLCQITAPHERALNEHFLGKKHKLKEAALRAEVAEKTPSIGSSLMTASKPVLGVGKHGVKFTDELQSLSKSSPGLHSLSEPLPHKETGQTNITEQQGLPPLQDNLDLGGLQKDQSALAENVESNCALFQISALAQDGHVLGKRHKLQAAFKSEVAGKIHSIGSSPMVAAKPVQGVGIVDPGIGNGVKCTDESLLDASLKKHDQPSLPQNLKSDDLLVEWNCALCQVVAPSERALNKHLRGKKHRLKEAALTAEGVGSCSVGPLPTTPMGSIQIAGTVDQSMEERVKFTAESLLLKKTGQAITEQHLPPLHGNLNLDSLKRSQCVVSQKVECSCLLCQGFAPSEQPRNDHLQVKKHKSKESGAEVPSLTTSKSVQVTGIVDSCMEGVEVSESLPLRKTGEKSFKAQGVPPLQESMNLGNLQKSNSAQAKKVESEFTSESEPVKFKSDSLLLKKAGETSVKEMDPPLSHENMNLGNLKKNQSALTQNVDLICAPYQITAPNEKALVEHLRGKEHMLKAAEMGAQDAKNHTIEPSPVVAAKCAVVGTRVSDKEGVKIRAESSLGESLKKQNPPLLPVKLNWDNLRNNQFAKNQNREWGCALCQMTASSERALNEHLLGKKHRLKEVAVIVEGAGESCNVELSATSAMKFVWVARTIESKENTREASLEEKCLPLQNMHMDDYMKNQSPSTKKVESSCANEHGLQEHLEGKKHKLKKAALIDEAAGLMPPLNTAAKSVQAVGTMDQITEERVKSTIGSFLARDTGESNLVEQHMLPLQENLHDSKANQSELLPKVERSCALCKVVAPNEQALTVHLHGKKHKLNEARARKSIAAATESVLAAETTDLSMEELVKFTSESEPVKFKSESLLLRKTGEVSVKEMDPPLSHENMNLGNLKKNQSAFTQNVDLSCAPFQITAPNEQALVEHLRGKEHMLKAVEMGAQEDGKNHSIGPSPVVATKCAVVGTRVSGKEGVKITAESSLGESLKKPDPPLLPVNLNWNNLRNNQVVKNQNRVWSCALCQVTATSERALNEHLQGKKHRLKEVTVRVEGNRESCNIGLSATSATKSVWVARAIDQSTDLGMKFGAESLWLENTGEASLEEKFLPLQENMYMDDYMNNQSPSTKEVESSCASNEHGLQEHLEGKKHKIKKAALIDEEAEKMLSVMTATKSVQAVGTMDQCTEERVKFTNESFLARDTGESSLVEQNMPPLQENVHSDYSKANRSELLPQVEWSCSLCQVVAPNEQALNVHMRGKKHKLNEARARISVVTATESVLAVETTDPSMEELVKYTSESEPVKFKSESLLLRKAGETSVKEMDPPLSHENTNLANLKKNQSVFTQNVDLSCAPYQITVPNEKALVEHLRGKEHMLKAAEMGAQEDGKNHSIGPSPMVAANCAVVGTRVSDKVGVKITAESSLGESLKKQDLPLLPVNLNWDNLRNNQFVKNQNREWSCALCQVTATSEQALNEHLQGKKHSLKEVAVRVEGAGESRNIGLSATSATKSVWVARTIDQCTEERVKFTAESLPLEKPEEASLKECCLPPLQEKLHMSKRVESSIAFCQVGTSGVQGHHEQLQGKKHGYKKVESIAEGAGKKLSSMTAANSVHAVGTMDPRMEETVKCTSEPFLQGVTGESNLKEQNLPPLQENVNSDDLKKNQSTFVQKVDKSCALCQVTATSEQGLNEHLQGKKHRLKEALLRDEVPITSTKPLHVVGVTGPNSGGVNFTDKSFLLKELGEATSNGVYPQPMLDNRSSHYLINDQSPLVQNVPVNGYPKTKEHGCGCEPCNVGASSQTITNSHKKRNEHLKWRVKSEGKSGCGSPHPKQNTECAAEYGINTTSEYFYETPDAQISEDDWPIDSFKAENCKLVHPCTKIMGVWVPKS